MHPHELDLCPSHKLCVPPSLKRCLELTRLHLLLPSPPPSTMRRPLLLPLLLLPLHTYGGLLRLQPITPRRSAAAAPSRPLPGRVAAAPKAQMELLSATASAAAATPFLRPALQPILFVIGGSLLGTVPSGVKAFWPVRSEEAREKQKLMRRVFTGCMLGVIVSLWIFSGTWWFLSVFALMAIIAQNEYFAMARENGCYPTWKLGTLGSVGMYVAAATNSPVLRETLFPLTGVIVTVYLMLRRQINPVGIESKTPPLTMNDVSTTFMGIYYFGYMPSFWVRLRCLGALESSAVLSQLIPAGSALWSWPLVARLAASSADIFTCGALVQWCAARRPPTAHPPASAASRRPRPQPSRRARPRHVQVDDDVDRDRRRRGLLCGQALRQDDAHRAEPAQDVSLGAQRGAQHRASLSAWRAWRPARRPARRPAQYTRCTVHPLHPVVVLTTAICPRVCLLTTAGGKGLSEDASPRWPALASAPR